MRSCLQLVLFACAFAGVPTCYEQSATSVTPRIIELTADHDSRYRQGGKVAPTIEALARESLILRIKAVRAKEVARDGSVHGLTLLDKNSNAVPGWKFFLHPGIQEIAVSAPAQPGRYTAVCTIICSDGHEGMGFTLLVTDPGTNGKA